MKIWRLTGWAGLLGCWLLALPAAGGDVRINADDFVGVTRAGGAGSRTTNSLPEVTLTTTDAVATEANTGAGETADPAVFTLTRVSGSGAVEVGYTVTGTATEGADFSLSGPMYDPLAATTTVIVGTLSGTVVLPADVSSVTIDLLPIDDQLAEGPETVVLTLKPGTTYTVGTPGAAAAELADNDAAIVVGVTTTDAVAREADLHPAKLLFVRSGDLTSPLTLPFTVGGDASPGSDYVALPSSVTFAANSAQVELTLTPLDDTEIENQETVTVTLTAGEGYALGTASSTTLYIKDNDAPVAVTIAALIERGSEGALGTTAPSTPVPAACELSRSGDTTLPLTVNYNVGGTATPGDDYAALSGTATIPAFVTTLVLTVTPVDDTLSEGDETVVITVAPGTGYAVGTPASATLYITDNEVNSKPVVESLTYTAVMDQTLNITLVATDADNDPLYWIINPPAHGLLAGTPPNITYTPTAGYLGADSFTYAVHDYKETSDSATVSITVSAAPNTPPVAQSQAVTTSANQTVAIVLQASDADGDALAYAIYPPANGYLAGTAPNITYTPNADFVGQDSFSFKVGDGKSESELAVVTVTVAAANLPPVAEPASLTTPVDKALELTLVAADPEGAALGYLIHSFPAHGSLSGTAPNLVYTPEAGFSGADSFTFTATDGEAESNLATVTITVSGDGNHAPEIVVAAMAVVMDQTASLVVGAMDPDEDALIYTWAKVSGPGSVSFAHNGTAESLSSQAQFSAPGEYALKVTVSDGKAQVESAVSVFIQDQSLLQATAFVEHFCQQALGRSATSGEINAWAPGLASGAQTGSALGRSLFASAEFSARGLSDSAYVTCLYQTCFNREPSATELSDWVNELVEGEKRTCALYKFLAAEEFDAFCSAHGVLSGRADVEKRMVARDFSCKIYRTSLGRYPTDAEMSGWEEGLISGTKGGASVCRQVLKSAEFVRLDLRRGEFVEVAFKSLFDREPTTAEFDSWLAKLDQRTTRGRVLDQLLATAEFSNRCAGLGLPAF